MLPSYFNVLLDNKLEIHASDVSSFNNENILSIINGFEDEEWRISCFNQYIWDNVALTALSKDERDKLIGRPSTMLTESSWNLRLTDNTKDDTRGSEIAEILLYGLMSDHYKALPVIPKIFYKQNKNDFVKGADSVHIVVNKDQTDFSLWLGEAKFYNSIEDTRLYKIVESVKDMLSTEKIKKENSIITNLNDLKKMGLKNDLYTKIVSFLNKETSIDILKPKLHIPILLLHECSITKSTKEQDEDYLNKIKKYHIERTISYVSKQISSLSTSIKKYSEITFHVILFPVPSKKDIVDSFIRKAKVYKE